MHDSSPALMSGAISRSPAGNALSTAASAAALAGQKSRSVMACVLCRKQKVSHRANPLCRNSSSYASHVLTSLPPADEM